MTGERGKNFPRLLLLLGAILAPNSPGSKLTRAGQGPLILTRRGSAGCGQGVLVAHAPLRCTLLPGLAALLPSPSTALMALRPFAAPTPGRTIGLVWRRTFPRLETLRNLVELIAAHLPPGVMAMVET